MANTHTVELIETYIALLARNRTFATSSEYLAWRSGVVVGLLATIADNDSLIKSELRSQLNRVLGGNKGT